VLVPLAQVKGLAAEGQCLVLAASQPRDPAQVGQVPGLPVRVAGLLVELDGRFDGGRGLLPVRGGDGQEPALEDGPRQQEQVTLAA
jgi:hypothetical protein